MPRDALLTRALVQLADTRVDHVDDVELVTLLTGRCTELLDVSAAGLMLGTREGDLQVTATSSETMRLLELFELRAQEGPCLDCYRSGEPVVKRDLAVVDGRWPRFARRALEAGFRSAHAFPMRRRGDVIGALNLFRTTEGTMSDADSFAAQALADVTTIALLRRRAALDAQGQVDGASGIVDGTVAGSAVERPSRADPCAEPTSWPRSAHSLPPDG